MAAVVASLTVSLGTLKRNVKSERACEVSDQVLNVDVEKDLVHWILVMQRAMIPDVPWDILGVANDIYQVAYRNTRSQDELTTRLFRRFLGRHFELCNGVAGPLSRLRQGADQVERADQYTVW